jgi:hypothetical protein
MDAMFYTKTGLLNAYALACGYVEVRNGWRLYKDGCYHVHKDVDNWLTFGTLTEARKVWRKLSK